MQEWKGKDRPTDITNVWLITFWYTKENFKSAQPRLSFGLNSTQNRNVPHRRYKPGDTKPDTRWESFW